MKSVKPEILAPREADSQSAPTRIRVNQYTAKPKDLSAFKKAIKNGEPIQAAMLSAGFPKSVAKQGMRRLPPRFQKIVLQERRRNIALARQFTPDELKNYVIGGLITNTIDGTDSAVRSYELLGKTKDLALFTPDSATGVIVINAAPIPSFDSIPGHSVTHTVTPIPELPE